jgi:RHS repeat-associated protein
VRRETPFGGPRGIVTAWPNTKGFVGGTVDDTGLVHLGAREYDPVIGRFTSGDPLQVMTDPQQWNGFAYANNSPVTFSDPSGLRVAPEDSGQVSGNGGKSGSAQSAMAAKQAGLNLGSIAKNLGNLFGNSVVGHGDSHAHDTAVGLRVLDLQTMFGGKAWITATMNAGPGADLVCWNCGALQSGGKIQAVWVWEFKAEAQADAGAVTSLENGIAWAENNVLRAKVNGQGVPVKAGPKFPAPRTGVNRHDPRELVTVYSDQRPEKNGLEWYRTDDFDKAFAPNHRYAKESEAGVYAASEENHKSEIHARNLTQQGVVDDPVSGWAIAGGIGLGVAFGGYALLAGFGVIGGGAALGAVAVGSQADYALAG